MGGYFLNFKEKNPIRISSSQGASITFLFVIIYLVILVALMFIPVYNYFKSAHAYLDAPLHDLILTSLALFIMSLIFAFIFINIGLKSFRRDI
jgi:RsiW-degrading membrane proteinase PrsW (M82 family)